MIKILNVTIHVGSNYGSALQTYATCYLFGKFGCIVQTLHYIPPRVTWRRYILEIHSLRDALSHLFFFPIRFVEKYLIFGRFLKKNCNLTCPFYTLDEIKNNLPDADVYVAGSDQLWNSTHNEGIDEVYYYDYLPTSAKRISFASSIGKDHLSEKEMKIVATYLKQFSCLSVREKSAELLLNKMGICGITQILDPTLLIDKDEWRPLIHRRVVKECYLLVYIPYNVASEAVIAQTAKKIASKYNLKIVTFAKHYWGYEWADKNIKFASPNDFLSLFEYADFILTNSFHGTAFSVNFNKQFWVYEPSKFPTRIYSLLELTKLHNRLLYNEISDSDLEKAIDYSNINDVLNNERKKAYSFIKQAIR